MAEMKSEIKEFIREHFDADDLERARDLSSNCFKAAYQVELDDQAKNDSDDMQRKIERLWEENDQIIDDLEYVYQDDERNLVCLHQLMEWISELNVKNMDKESMVAFRSSGFIFGPKGNLVIFNER
jgi:hypothetical protein